MRILLIGLTGDRLSEAALESCSQLGEAVEVFISVKSPRPSSDAPAAMPQLAGREAMEWRGDMTQILDVVREKGLNIIVTAGCHHILSEPVLGSAELGCFNVHPSLLPWYRGHSPIFWQYHEGDRNAGVTVHRMNRGVDTGPIMGQESFEIPLGSPLLDVVPLYSAVAGRLVTSLLSQISRGQLEEFPQVELPVPRSAPKPKDADYDIDWGLWTLDRIWHFLRMTPGTVRRALSGYEKEAPGKHWDVSQMEICVHDHLPGTLFRDEKGYAIAHREGALRLRSV